MLLIYTVAGIPQQFKLVMLAESRRRDVIESQAHSAATAGAAQLLVVCLTEQLQEVRGHTLRRDTSSGEPSDIIRKKFGEGEGFFFGAALRKRWRQPRGVSPGQATSASAIPSR